MSRPANLAKPAKPVIALPVLKTRLTAPVREAFRQQLRQKLMSLSPAERQDLISATRKRWDDMPSENAVQDAFARL